MENKDQISKWLNDELNPRELEAFKKTADYERYRGIVENACRFQGPAFDEQENLKLLKRRMAEKKSPVVRTLNYSKLYQVAAILVVLIASGLWVLLSAPQTITTGYAETAELQLPGQSQVRLNAVSEIKYDPDKWNKKRKVQLDGEAYFEVQNGKEFVVETDQGIVRVLGTKFNVKNRPGFFEVQCYEGSVKVTHGKGEIILKKGQSFKIIEGEDIDIAGFDHALPSWIFQESQFKAVPLKEVLAEFERQFNTEVVAKNIDQDQLFTGSFSHKDSDIALKSITIPLQLEYNFETDRKVILYEEK